MKNNVDYATLSREIATAYEWRQADMIGDCLRDASIDIQLPHLERSLAAVVREEDRQTVDRHGEGIRFWR